MKNLVLCSVCLILFFTYSCKNDNRKTSGTLKISCSNAYLREKPNKNSKDLALIENGEAVFYLKETKFTEIIEIKGKETTGNWLYVKYKNQEGWVFSGCIDGINKIANRNFTNDFDLKGRVFHYEDEVSYVNIEKCEFSCECDCGIGVIEFEDDKTCYMSSHCCCDSPDDYYKGFYEINDNRLLCNFKGKHVVEYDSENTKVDDIGNPLNPKPTIILAKDFSFSFKIDYCPNGFMYLLDTVSNNTYAKIQLNSKNWEIEKPIEDLLKSL